MCAIKQASNLVEYCRYLADIIEEFKKLLSMSVSQAQKDISTGSQNRNPPNHGEVQAVKNHQHVMIKIQIGSGS